MSNATLTDEQVTGLFSHYAYGDNGWNKFTCDVLGVTLDEAQEQIVYAVQHNSRVRAQSGHARGKDYVAAVVAECHMNLRIPSKTLCIAPGFTQVVNIMMTEITKIHNNAKYPLGGTVLTQQIKHDGYPDWFLLGFKPSDYDLQTWTGFHSQNLMVIVTEADGLAEDSWNAIEGLLTGDSRLLMVLNPNATKGKTYSASLSQSYANFKLSCLTAPNVIAKRTIYPGQVDYEYVVRHVRDHTTEISPEEYTKAECDFHWEGKTYRPDDFFRVKVLGEYPRESEGVLIPASWIDAAMERWPDAMKNLNGDPLMLGVDVAGMGRDATVFIHRYGNVVTKIDRYLQQDHMATVGRTQHELELGSNGKRAIGFVDTIGEGAGVYSRGRELKLNVVSAKASESAEGLTDISGEITFQNMRAYMYWAIRDALDPKQGVNLALPPDPELKEELAGLAWEFKSTGKVQLEDKDKIKERIGRSPDKADALSLTYYPPPRKPRAALI